MKANLFAAALLSICICPPTQATPNPVPLTQQSTTKIDLNKADSQMLTRSIKGIGKKRAEAIVKYREENGNFKNLDDLAKVKGFGPQFVKKHGSELQQVFTIH